VGFAVLAPADLVFAVFVFAGLAEGTWFSLSEGLLTDCSTGISRLGECALELRSSYLHNPKTTFGSSSLLAKELILRLKLFCQ